MLLPLYTHTPRDGHPAQLQGAEPARKRRMEDEGRGGRRRAGAAVPPRAGRAGSGGLGEGNDKHGDNCDTMATLSTAWLGWNTAKDSEGELPSKCGIPGLEERRSPSR